MAPKDTPKDTPKDKSMKKIFSSQEIKFILVFAGIFIMSVVILSLLGLVPSEFKVNGGETFEQRAQSAVREVFEGRSSESSISVTGSVKESGSDLESQTVSQNNTKNNPQTDGSSVVNTPNTTNTIYAENPIRIVIPSIDVDSIILNPTSAKNEILDAELTKGVVRYPGSGLPGSGNMFLFGHSTGFSIVQNKAFKVFNNLQNLRAGDKITIYGNEGVYVYSVKTVKKVDKDNALVKFDTQNDMITLSTCDSFGKPSDRYVVEGDLVSVSKR